jgi:hypothetical protein
VDIEVEVACADLDVVTQPDVDRASSITTPAALTNEPPLPSRTTTIQASRT